MDLEDKLRHERNRALQEGHKIGRQEGVIQGRSEGELAGTMKTLALREEGADNSH